MEDFEKRISFLRNTFRNRKIVFFGGAGVSSASGIPDFRSSSGLFSSPYGEDAVPADEILSAKCLKENKELFFDFLWNRMIYPDAMPNSAHKKLAQLEKTGHQITVVTQNVDGLHQMAGSKNVIELHGNIRDWYCMDCGEKMNLKDVIPLKNEKGIPVCPKCGGVLRPDMVLYNESLDDRKLSKATFEIFEADVLIVCGTSLKVFPAAEIIDRFRKEGECLALINRTDVHMFREPDVIFHEDIEEVFKAL